MHSPVDKNIPITAGYDFHLQNEKGYAVDYGTPMKSNLYAVVGGKVEKFYTWWGGSDTLILHGDNGVFYLYAHCFSTVKTGRVNEGEVIALSGNDGNSTGPHLHIGASKDYARLKAYSTSVEKEYIDQVVNSENYDKYKENKGDNKPMENVKLNFDKGSSVIKFNGGIWTYDSNGNRRNGKDTPNGWWALAIPYHNGWVKCIYGYGEEFFITEDNYYNHVDIELIK